MASSIGSLQRHPFRVRTVTVFLYMPDDQERQLQLISEAGQFLAQAQALLQEHGHEVQTLRIATQPFSSGFLGSGEALAPAAAAFEAACNASGITFISIGTSDRTEDLQHVPAIIAATTGVSCSFATPNGCSWKLAQQAAGAILQVARTTDGKGNFRFCTAANCRPGIPFFPVACASQDLHRTFAIGTECDALLHAAFTAAAGQPLEAAAAALNAELVTRLSPLADLAATLEADDGGFRFQGLDTSIAPGLDTPSLTESYELLGLCGRGGFGGPGTLATSAMITQVLKSLPFKLTGYCGLMLAVCEDEGLAAAAASGAVTVSTLLQCSAVCGCGLDTVPVPGPNGDAAHDAELQQRIAAVLMDVCALAFRLDKPLGCRLLPMPGKRPGDPTDFDNPYLIQSKVMALT